MKNAGRFPDEVRGGDKDGNGIPGIYEQSGRHGFQITMKAFILSKEQADYTAGGIINGTVQSVFGLAAKPFKRCSIDLNELAGMGFAFPAVGTVPDFFLFGAFKTCIF